MKKYKARVNNYYLSSDEEAQVVGNYLDSHFPDGKIDPNAVVTLASEKDSVLHQYFEWNDYKAAHAYRLEQARKIIRALVVDVNGVELPAYHNVYVKQDDSRSYLDLDQCRNVPTLWSQVLESALNEAKSWAKRYKSYSELEPIRQAITIVEKEVKHG